MRWISLFVLTVLASGCATKVKNPEEARQQTSVTFDKYSGTTNIEGPKLDTGEFPNMTTLSLVGFVKPGLPTDRFALSVHHWSQTGWNFFDRASDSVAVPLDVKPLNRDVTPAANVEEDVAIALPRSYLDSHKVDGLDIRLAGSGGAIVLTVPAAYVQGFLARYDSAVGTSATANVSSKNVPPILGVRYVALTPALSGGLRLNREGGVMIVGVTPASPADKAGLRQGDVLLSYSGHSVLSEDDLRREVANSSQGDSIPIVIWRSGSEKQLDITY